MAFGHLLAVGLFHVDHFNLWQSIATVTFCDYCQSVFAIFGIPVGFHAGRGTAEDGAGAPQAGQVEGGVAGMVARRGLELLVAVVVLLVDDNELQVVERQEDGTAGAEQHLVGAAQGPLPHLGALARAETRMVDAYAVAEVSAQAVDNLRRQGYLRQQEQGLVAFADHLVYQFDIHLRLAAGGHAVEQESAGRGLWRSVLPFAGSVQGFECFFVLFLAG